MKDLAKLMKSRPPPTKAQFDKAFAQSKAADVAATSEARTVTLEDVTLVDDAPTKAAILVDVGAQHSVWIPRSQIVSMADIAAGKVVVTLWLAEQRGWV